MLWRVDRLIKRPAAQQHHGQPRNDENPLVGRVRRDVADEDVLDQVGGRGEQVVRGGGNDLGEDRAQQQSAHEGGQPVARRVGNDLVGLAATSPVR